MSWFSKFFNKSVLYEKSYDGTDSYFVESNTNINSTTNLALCENHPILTPGLLFISNLFAQARLEVRSKTTGELITNNRYSKLLNNPNFYQTRIDFLESLQFLKIAQGRAIIWMRKPVGFAMATEMFILRDDLIDWPDGFTTPLNSRSSIEEEFKNQVIIYDVGALDIPIKIGDLMFLFDMPNIGTSSGALDGNFDMLDNGSRIDGIRQTCINTLDSLVAKNTILKSNGKEMLSSSGGQDAPFTPQQQEKAKKMFNTAYGPGQGRSRAFITSSAVTWTSLHVALRDLGLDESVKTDGNIIYTALHIPKDILSLEAKKTTYNNFKESMTSFIQNDISAMGNDLAESFAKEDGDDSVIYTLTYDHLPVMKFLDKEKFESKSAQAKALDDLRRSGLPDEMCLAMVDLPINTKLNPIIIQQTPDSNAQSNGQADDKTKLFIAETFAERN